VKLTTHLHFSDGVKNGASPPLPLLIVVWCLIKPGDDINLVYYCFSMDVARFLIQGDETSLRRAEAATKSAGKLMFQQLDLSSDGDDS
jgi:hypothetical protein